MSFPSWSFGVLWHRAGGVCVCGGGSRKHSQMSQRAAWCNQRSGNDPKFPSNRLVQTSATSGSPWFPGQHDRNRDLDAPNDRAVGQWPLRGIVAAANENRASFLHPLLAHRVLEDGLELDLLQRDVADRKLLRICPAEGWLDRLDGVCGVSTAG